MINCNANIDLAQAADLVTATKSLLEEYRDDTVCQYAVSIAKLHDIEPSLPVKTRQKRLPKRFEDSIVLGLVGSRDSVSCDQEYKNLSSFLSWMLLSLRFQDGLTKRTLKLCMQFKLAVSCQKSFSPSALQPLVEL